MVKKIKENAPKFDDGKIRYELVPIGALRQVAQVFTFGAKKYGEGTWKGGLKWSRHIGAIFRHVWAFAGGEDFDPESGLHHMAHAGACCLILLSFVDIAIVTDDRDKVNTQPFILGTEDYDKETRRL